MADETLDTTLGMSVRVSQGWDALGLEYTVQVLPADKPGRTWDERYPHTCSKCGGPAYIGLNLVDCIAGCR